MSQWFKGKSSAVAGQQQASRAACVASRVCVSVSVAGGRPCGRPRAECLICPDCPPKFSDWTAEARAGTRVLCRKLLMDAVLRAVIEGHCAEGKGGSRAKATGEGEVPALNEDVQLFERGAFF